MAELLSLYKDFKTLIETSSRNEKEAFLKSKENDKTFKYVLKFLIDPMVITGISTSKINKDINIGCYAEESCDYWIEDLLSYFNIHNTGKDVDIAYVKYYIEQLVYQEDIEFEEKLTEFLKAIVTKTLRIGVNVTTANKIYGKDFIKTLDVMLGTSIENCKIPEDAWISISHKLNGTRCFYYKGHLYSRQGKEFTGCQHIIDDIVKLQFVLEDFDYVLDGELLLKSDGILNDSERFQKGTGIANSNQVSKQELQLIIFDIVPTNEFEKGESLFLYQERRKQLEWLRKVIKDNHLSNIDIVEFVYSGYDHTEIEKALNYAEENDWEGVMVNLNATYVGKRTKNLIKVKKFYNYDLRVIGVEPGTGRNADRVGNFIVSFKGNKVGVGSGLSDEQRDYYWKHPEEIIGRVIEVKYKEVTKNKDGTESLQFPTLVSIREEGKEPSLE